MAFLSSLNIPLSGMTAQRFRFDIISQNIANADDYATRPEDVYKRKMTVFAEDRSFKKCLRLNLQNGELDLHRFNYVQLKGVEATQVVDDPTPPTPVYSPDNPLADEYGYIYESNVNVVVEQADAIAAANSYNANKEIFDLMKSMTSAALNIGKG